MRFLFLIAALVALQGSASANLIAKTWDLIEEGEVTPYGLLLRDHIISSGGVAALGATITGVSELAWPRASSGCGHSKLINAWVGYTSGHCDRAALSDAIDSYAVVVAQAIDNLRILGHCCYLPAPWPTLENSCSDWGRIYDIDNVWAASHSSIGVGVHAMARRLYTAFSARANNLGAAASSAVTQPSIELFAGLEPELSNYLALVVDQSAPTCAVKSKQMLRLAGSLKSKVFKQAKALKHQYLAKCH